MCKDYLTDWKRDHKFTKGRRLFDRLDESHLTGESEDVLKDCKAAPLVASGSRVLEGVGQALVLAVGENSQQGVIAAMVAGVDSGDGDSLRCVTEHLNFLK